MKSLSQTVDVETPELVVVSYTLAGAGARVAAAAIDMVIVIGIFIILAVLVVIAEGAFLHMGGGVQRSAAVQSAMTWIAAIVILAIVGVQLGYNVLFEGLADGRTPGKRFLRLRVVRDGGYSVGFAASAARNFVRLFVDLQPGGTGLIGILTMIFSKSGKRVGDMVAGTIVVREEILRHPVSAEDSGTIAEPTTPLEHSTVLRDDEFDLVSRWLERARALDAARRETLQKQIADRVRHAFPIGSSDPDEVLLSRLHASERAARDRGLAARSATGAARSRYAIVATQSPRWIRFASTLADVQKKGLASLGEDGVRLFVSEYRALSSDLARLQTAAHGAFADDVFYLGRLVAGAHNVIYKAKRIDLVDAVRYLWIDVPAEIRRSWRPIVLSASLMFIPAAITWVAVATHPASAPALISAPMMDRVNAGVHWAKSGEGYIPDPGIGRPFMSSAIIGNNVKVAYAVFAFGVTLGVGTALLLLLNGVSIGGVFGLYQSKGILSLILAFVAPHSVLELSAVTIAGAGGFLIAWAVIAPGSRTRRRALAENIRRAMRLLAAATLFLLAAGSLEGMVSPIPWWPLFCKVAVAGATALLMYVYIRAGAGRPAPVVPTGSPSP